MDHVLFPRFWIEEPALWFAQIEAVFTLNNITSDTDKYDYILCELPNTVISLIKDLILTTKEYDIGKFQKIKKELIKRISIAELSKIEIGSRKPSDFLKYLKEKADPRVPEEAIKELWLKKLPLHVGHIVSDFKGELEYMCKLADTINEYIPMPYRDRVIEKPNVASNNDFNELTNILQDFGAQLNSIQNELLKVKIIYNENKTHLESIQTELQKFKHAFSANNIRLENIQSELKKIKLSYCSENNNDLCKICEKNNITDESNCKDDEPNNSY